MNKNSQRVTVIIINYYTLKKLHVSSIFFKVLSSYNSVKTSGALRIDISKVDRKELGINK